MSHVVIIDYGSGNLHSAAKAFEAVATKDCTVQLSSDPATLKDASHIVLPGVGAFGDCYAGLQALDGLLETLEEEVREKQKPFLGICVGMQLLAQKGFEHGEHKGLGWLNAEVKSIRDSIFKDQRIEGEVSKPSEPSAREALAHLKSSKISGGVDKKNLKIPHMGWNDLALRSDHPLLNGLETGDHAYFVHSYAMQCQNPEDVIATVDYGQPLTAIVARDNITGVQFHPEKSQETGLKLIANFLKM